LTEKNARMMHASCSVHMDVERSSIARLKPTNPTQALNKHRGTSSSRWPANCNTPARKESGRPELCIDMCQQRANYRVLVRTVDLVLLGASLVCLPVLRAQTSQPPLTQQAPLWSAKPKQVGYSLSVVVGHFRPSVGGDRVKIQFLNDQRLALAWLTFDEIGQKPIGPGTNVPSHLHLTILNSRSGQRTVSHEWPCSSIGVNLAYTAAGQWLMSSDQTVALYSSSFEKLRDLPDIKPERFHTLYFTKWTYLSLTRLRLSRRMVCAIEGLGHF
jgi:hypothetical protein